MKWTIENGVIRFSEPISGTIEVVVRDDIDPSNAPDYQDSLFNGDNELIRLYTPMVRAFVRMKLAERVWKDAKGQAKNEAKETLALSSGQYEMAKSQASSMRSNRESGVIRMQPIIKRGRGDGWS